VGVQLVDQRSHRAQALNARFLGPPSRSEQRLKVGLVEDWRPRPLLKLHVLGSKNISLNTVEVNLVVKLDDVCFGASGWVQQHLYVHPRDVAGLL